jgi:sigma-B regulation protein RsbU (phosphoserine phosphatase)
MNPSLSNRIRSLWQRTKLLDRIAWVFVLLGVLVAAMEAVGLQGLAFARTPEERLFTFLLILSGGYLLVFRGIPWARAYLLWSLRNRLIVAYVFIAVVPLLLVLIMAALSAYLMYWQFGAYLVRADIDDRLEELSSTADTFATSLILDPVATGKSTDTPPSGSAASANVLADEQANLPGLQVKIGAGEELLQRSTDPAHLQFSGLVYMDHELALRAVTVRRYGEKRLIVSASVPFTPELLATLDPSIGSVEVETLRPRNNASEGSSRSLERAGRIFVREALIEEPQRKAPPPANLFDGPIAGLARLEAVDATDIADPRARVPVLIRFDTRPSLLNQRLFSGAGFLGGAAATALLIISGVFLVIEAGALLLGIFLTRTITSTIRDLYRATQHVQAGDFSYRIHVEPRDQLGVLAQSFNSMTASVGTLIKEQARRQQLENELAVAREVQAQLFPKARPSLPGVEIDAICRPAQIVSGDYYDFLPLGPSRLGIALADISGKGISAALLMASLQAALRSQATLNGQGPTGTAEVVARLNQHLYRSSSDERFATFFYGVYDAVTRRLQYTNAGHPPPLYFTGNQIQRLEAGGTVLGLFDDRAYEQETIEIAAHSVLVAYSDGLIEIENAAGEEFGLQRMIEVMLRHLDSPPHAAIEALATAAEQWSGTTEMSDDMTIVVAHF